MASTARIGRIGYLAAWNARIVSRTERGRVREKRSVADVVFEVGQTIKWRVPSTVGPDIIENAVVVDAVATANGHLALPSRIPSETDSRGVIVIACWPHPLHRTDCQTLNATEVKYVATNVRELCQNPMRFAGSSEPIPPYSEIYCQPGSDLPVVLNEPVVIM